MRLQCLRFVCVGGIYLVFEKLKRNSSGVSSVLGEILITGVFVLSLGSIFVFVNSMDKPVDSTHLGVEEWVDAPSDIIYLRHAGGEPIDTKDLKINVNIDGKTYVYPSANISANLGGKSFWELSDVIEINTSKEWGVSVPDEDDLVVKLVDTESREVLPKCRISFTPKDSTETPTEPDPVDFEIINDTVVPNGTFISSFKVLGAAITNGENGYDLMVTTRLKVGNETFDPWGDYSLAVTGNVNDKTTHSWNPTSTYPAGTPVTIGGKSWLHKSSSLNYSLDSSWTQHMEVSSTGDSKYLIVLKNGDPVPTIKGFSNQDSIADFVEAYVKDDKILLEDNEAIFLFELGVTDLTNDAADFQDLVILMEINPA